MGPLPTPLDRVIAPAAPVLLATDLGPTSAMAESDAIALAAEQHRPLVIVSVIDPSRLRLPGGVWHTRVDQDRRVRELSMLRLVERARASGVAARYLVWEGKPGEAILEAARAEDAAVIVVGSHRRGRLGRLVLGSVSRHIVERADRPVIVADIEPASGHAQDLA
jgi:nucleotide-binding universal stress UspA family protein